MNHGLLPLTGEKPGQLLTVTYSYLQLLTGEKPGHSEELGAPADGAKYPPAT